MRYPNIHKAVFLSRPNRFIAHVALAEPLVGAAPLGGPAPGPVVAHVKNTGRCKELLVPGATVYLERSNNPARKTLYDLIAVEKGAGNRLINMDAQAPNKVFAEWAAAGRFVPGLTLLRPETTFGASRFDFYWEAGDRRGFVEVKGCTLERDGAAYFPDAPTQRGVKHVEELMAARSAGYEAALFLVIQMKGVDFWSPNDATHPAFGGAVRRAQRAGVQVLAYDCDLTPDSLEINAPVEVRI